MAIRDHLTDLYERSECGSTKYRISEYLLLNWERIGQHTLSEMAKNMYVSKSVLSKFFTMLTEEGSYDSFCIAVRKEQQGRFLFQSRMEEIHEKVVSAKEIKSFVQILLQADRVMIIADSSLISHLRPLSYLLFDRHIPTEIMPFYYDKMLIQHLQSLTSSSILVLFEPEDSSYQKMSQRTLEFDFPDLVEKLHTTVFHMCHPDHHLYGTRMFELYKLHGISQAEQTDQFCAQFYRQLVS